MKHCINIVCPQCGYENVNVNELRCMRCNALLILKCNGNCRKCSKSKELSYPKEVRSID